ncbi:nucleolar pre-ribosomal-associated protein 1-like [Centruroides sculpturatus]|uniref:nucleolar pre-ribosomal-associated protein 1-like n=1 Tax=Centruroides sculpturatus TaxID=218467 RepID=UPI000C6EC1A1|nr:nucleolar pre-ribosomal-associated protein 1-like [Centruroides sculpturatus]
MKEYDLKQFIVEAQEYSKDNSNNDIVEEYLQYSGNCSELLDLLQGKKKSSEMTLIFNVIEHILLRISEDLTSYEKVGYEIVQKILRQVSDEEINFVRDAAHQFMISVCCSHKNGIIFSNRIMNNSGKNPNHTITNILNSLNAPYADRRYSDFVIKVLQACPDQMKFYLPSLKDAVIPRNSLPWIQAITLIKEIINSQKPLQLLKKSEEKFSILEIASFTILSSMPSIISKDIINENLKMFISGSLWTQKVGD